MWVVQLPDDFASIRVSLLCVAMAVVKEGC